jgi:citrate lyase subunit beta/citryl-CoA lyase/malyl-CoA/(S)-citramalyl-CoA lyase
MKPRRTVLSVPGHIEKMHHKASQSRADVIMLDLEDSVPVDQKIAARQQVIKSLRSLDWQEKVVTFRCNPIDTPFGYRDLLEVAESVGNRLDAVVIPKVNHAGDVVFADRLLGGIELNKGLDNSIGIEASIETAPGLECASTIAQASRRLKTLVFGIADYSASIGAKLVSISGHGEKEEEIYSGHRWHFVLSRIVMTAKTYGLAAIDAPYGNFRDEEGLKRSAATAAALGCDGKWAIHPDQVEPINAIFSPTPEDIKRAFKVLSAFKKAQREGRGAVSVDGRMVDQATVRLAQQLWSQAEYLNLV